MTSVDVAYCERKLSELPPIDWADLEKASEVAEQAARSIGDDKRLLRGLIDRVRSRPELFDLCECHDLDDKIVLYDDLPRGYRIRLRLAKDEQYERAHNHRFPFAVYILYGQYFQQWYAIKGEASERTTPEDVTLLARRIEQTGSSFTISADAFHSTQTPPKTISLMICGQPVRKKSFIINMESGKVWGKIGRKDETKDEIDACKMPRDVFENWVKFMEGAAVI
jgi:hypothetical protein